MSQALTPRIGADADSWEGSEMGEHATDKPSFVFALVAFGVWGGGVACVLPIMRKAAVIAARL